MKNYLDRGLISSQKMQLETEKILQEVKYKDSSIFRGQVFLDEETQLIYKEGQGRLDRETTVSQNLCFYNQIIGNWSRGILHGKRLEFRMNMNDIPAGYYSNI